MTWTSARDAERPQRGEVMIDDALVFSGHQGGGLLAPPGDAVIEPLLEAMQRLGRFCVVE